MEFRLMNWPTRKSNYKLLCAVKKIVIHNESRFQHGRVLTEHNSRIEYAASHRGDLSSSALQVDKKKKKKKQNIATRNNWLDNGWSCFPRRWNFMNHKRRIRNGRTTQVIKMVVAQWWWTRHSLKISIQFRSKVRNESRNAGVLSDVEKKKKKKKKKNNPTRRTSDRNKSDPRRFYHRSLMKLIKNVIKIVGFNKVTRHVFTVFRVISRWPADKGRRDNGDPTSKWMMACSRYLGQ